LTCRNSGGRKWGERGGLQFRNDGRQPADYAIVVASDAETGGSWAGATETLKNGWIPVFVLEHAGMPEGNKLLLQKGALPFPHPFKEPPIHLLDWLKEKESSLPARTEQPKLL
jgi:predicted Rossmann fold nucleotide-binding protein DprA/Smf involved in DNA uptake